MIKGPLGALQLEEEDKDLAVLLLDLWLDENGQRELDRVLERQSVECGDVCS